MYVLLRTLCGCEKEMDVPQNLLHDEIAVPLAEQTVYNVSANAAPSSPTKVRVFRKLGASVRLGQKIMIYVEK